MDKKNFSNPKIEFEEDPNSIFFQKTQNQDQSQNQDIDKLKKRVNYLTFFILILLCGFIAGVYLNLKKMMTDVQEAGTGTISNLSKEIDLKITSLSEADSALKNDMVKQNAEIKSDINKDVNDIKTNLKNITIELQKMEAIEKAMRLSLDTKVEKDELTKTLDDSLADKITKSDLEQQIEALQKDLRMKLMRAAGDTENTIANAKAGLEKTVDKKISSLIRDFEINMKNYFRENISQFKKNEANKTQ